MRLSKISIGIATLCGLGNTKTGKLLASLFALPLLVIFKLLYRVNTKLFYGGLGLIGFIVLISTLFAIKNLAVEDRDFIVWDRIFGLMLAFVFIPLRFKLMIFGVIFFSILRFSFCGMQDKLSGLFGMFVSSVVAGLIVNVLLRFMIWIVY